jgi:CYTH domain-containing protein
VFERDIAAELARPKYASMERERRWLVDPSARPALEGSDCIAIEDRYLESTRMRLRRMWEPKTGWCSYKLTKKYDCEDSSIRPIVTAYLTADEYALFRVLPGRDLAKRRFRISLGGQVWSLDLFAKSLAGLELVEAETADNAALAALVPPAWTIKEVTHDPRYQCGSLAVTHTIPEE